MELSKEQKQIEHRTLSSLLGQKGARIKREDFYTKNEIKQSYLQAKVCIL